MIEPVSSEFQVDSLSTETPGQPPPPKKKSTVFHLFITSSLSELPVTTFFYLLLFDLFTMTVFLPFPESHIVRTMQTGVLSTAICISDFCMSFCGLMFHFLLLLSNTPLYGYTMVCLPIRLSKDILVTFYFGPYNIVTKY